jgi:putative SOS response-associated peptidase YedK
MGMPCCSESVSLIFAGFRFYEWVPVEDAKAKTKKQGYYVQNCASDITNGMLYVAGLYDVWIEKQPDDDESQEGHKVFSFTLITSE